MTFQISIWEGLLVSLCLIPPPPLLWITIWDCYDSDYWNAYPINLFKSGSVPAFHTTMLQRLLLRLVSYFLCAYNISHHVCRSTWIQ
jgi:hypothetical protein